MYGQCFHIAGDNRRCLVALEYRNLLSADRIVTLTKNMKSGPLTEDDVACLEAVKLAADCLFTLDQHNDCLLLLEPIIHIDDITRDSTRIYQQLVPGNLNIIAGKYIYTYNKSVLVTRRLVLYCGAVLRYH